MKLTAHSKTGIFLKQLEVGSMQNFCYIIGDEKSKQALVLDPAWEADRILQELEKEGYKLAGLIASHSHYDHMNAVAEILSSFDVPVFVNKEELSISKSGGEIFVDLSKNARPVWDEEEFKLGHTTLKFLHTPGHTPGGQCVQVGEYLLTGDTLFIGGCGRFDLPGGDEEALRVSLKRIAQLPGNLIVCPGHDYGAVPQRKLEEEKKDNKFLKD